MEDQDILEAKERVSALRKQIRQEQSEAAVRSNESAKGIRLTALTEEERHLEQMLEEVRGTVPVEPIETVTPTDVVNVPAEEITEGEAYVETVDAYGNLVRVRAEDAGTQEADAPPPNVPDDATMTSRQPRP